MKRQQRYDSLGMPLKRFTWNAGRHWRSLATYELRVGLGVSLHSGLELRLEIGLFNVFAWLAWQVFYNGRMQHRSNDRWEAEQLAGEHGGVTVNVQHKEAA